ncbi:MAG TPA: hypothetical protein VEA19_04445, partial [Actinomycetota bacterium]|nr:hypothetical protein [Actinomycetota bacterium]
MIEIRPYLRAALCVLALATILVSAGPASSDTACTLSGSTLSVNMSAPGDRTDVLEAGGDIVVLSPDGPECNAKASTVDLITIADLSGGDTVVVLDDPASFGSGATDEPGATDEIELSVELGAGDGDRLSLTLGGSGRTTAGTAGFNLNAGAESISADLDLTVSG